MSSSGHLALAEHAFGMQRPGLWLEVGLHLGTLAAVLLAYRGQIWPGRSDQAFALLFRLAVATLPAAIVGLLFRDSVDRLFGNMAVIGAAWCVTGLVLLIASARPPGTRSLDGMRLADAWWIGVCQAAALMPGISRSGVTIACGAWRGFEPQESARFSFLLSVPAVAGAVALQAVPVISGGEWAWRGPGLLIGMGVAAVTGVWAIGVCVRRLRTGTFAPFGYYCLALGALCLLRSAVTGA